MPWSCSVAFHLESKDICGHTANADGCSSNNRYFEFRSIQTIPAVCYFRHFLLLFAVYYPAPTSASANYGLHLHLYLLRNYIYGVLPHSSAESQKL